MSQSLPFLLFAPQRISLLLLSVAGVSWSCRGISTVVQGHTQKLARMANSKFEYVKGFEQDDTLLKNTWIVVRLDGRGFTKFTEAHGFQKPNDDRGLNLMNKSAEVCMNEINDIVLAYGQSDEFRDPPMYKRRCSKIITGICSLFSSAFVMNWQSFFPDTPLQYPPSFDGRAICYPADQNLRDYLSWRQTDCHINNLYNTTFWSLVHSGKTPGETQERLKKTFAADKNEILFSEFGINYNTLPPVHRKGTTLVFKEAEETVEKEGKKVTRLRRKVVSLATDMIGEDFWTEYKILEL